MMTQVMSSDDKVSAALPRRGLADGYAVQVNAHDEMLAADGSLRPHWRALAGGMDELGLAAVIARWDQARRIIRENGITHNVYGESDGLARPWSLDMLPLPLAVAEWDSVGKSLEQRARLLDALLADIYGPGKTLAAGLLPLELVYGNSGFLRPVHGMVPPRNQWLHLYAADLVRDAAGQFLVLADRTQSPSGAGYALENRIVLTRVLPTVFRECNVHRLAPFFIAMRQMLASLAPATRENPRVVLFTPGPYNETYFEHAYLARYLGYALVQGNDLTVRDGQVYLKTLSGLHRVDVILRRVDDAFVDPLELNDRSFLGVPGLLQAVRDGAVAVANAIGTGVLQAAALLPFLPGLCRHLLGEDLQLPSVPTWWCGQPQALQHVLVNLSRMVIKPAFPVFSSTPIFGEALSRAELDGLAQEIRARPSKYVGQEHVASATVPVLLNDTVQPRRFVVRAFLAAVNGGGKYALMPGGLTRITGSVESRVVSLQKGGGSKDTWIVASGPVSEISLLTPATQPVELSRGGGDLPSRVADDLFWLGRYLQRADATVRLARCLLNHLMDPNGMDDPRTLDVLSKPLVGLTTAGRGPHTARELAAAVLASSDPTGLRSSMGHVRALARTLRDHISGDAWRILQMVDRNLADFSGAVEDDQVASVLELLNALVTGFLSFGGMVSDSMTRGQAWRFLDMGLKLERGIAAANLVRIALVDARDDDLPLLDATLEVADSSLTYRRRYLTRLDIVAVADLLLADETNPRACAFQLAALEAHLAALPRDTNHPHRNRDHQIAIHLLAVCRLADLRLACQAVEGRREGLDEICQDALEHLNRLSEMLSQNYFTHATGGSQIMTYEQERM